TKEHYLKELAELLELTSPTVSHHMEILTRTGIVKLREKGKKIYYSINPDAISVLAQFFTQLEESLRNQYEDATS
ncbi:MAG: helix-turn-helix domain-containing protein, partial [Erysipelothrix sp.]